MTTQRSIFLCAFLFVAGGCTHTPRSSGTVASTVVGVCDLFSDIQKYRNKIVTVRGVYYYGLRESGCARPLETEGLRWPTALFLIDAGDHKDGERAVDFVTDEPSLRYLDETTAKLMPDIKAKRKHIVATITGQLLAREKYLSFDTDHGRVGNGYGHLNVFPAELVIKSVDKVDVVDDK